MEATAADASSADAQTTGRRFSGMSSSEEERKMEEGRVGEGEEEEVKEVYYPRRNGWNCPWHPLQILAWAFIVFFTATYFGFLIFYIPGAWRSIGYILGGGLFVTHILSSLVTSIMDPAEASVRRKRKTGKTAGGFLRTVFDRKKHSHVIEDRFCNLCNISVTSGAKHCSVCDKCVEGFDHHCIWLNTCIGSRNYRWFIVTVFSALVACVFLLAFTLSLFVIFFAARDRVLHNCNHHFISDNTSCSQQIRLFGAVVPDPVFPVAVGVVGVLALVGVVMIGYLAAFHVLLNVKGLTTYDYVMLQRRREKEREEEAKRELQEEKRELQEQEQEEEELEEEQDYHGRCWFLRRKVNRVAPSAGSGDVEKGHGGSSGSIAGGVVSSSPSIDSVGLANFGRSPPESVMSSVEDVGSMDLMVKGNSAAAAGRETSGHWMYGEKEDSRKEQGCRHEVVVEMETLPPEPEVVVSPGRAVVERETAKFGSGFGDFVARDIIKVFDQDVENCGILAFMSSANSVASEEKDSREEEDVENCGTLAFMSSSNSIASSSVSTGIQSTSMGDNAGKCSAIVCGHNSQINPNTVRVCDTLSDTQQDASRNVDTGTGENSGGVEPSGSSENNELRERGYEMMIKSGNTVGMKALKQLSSIARQLSPTTTTTTRGKTENMAVTFHGVSHPLGHESRQSQLVQQLRPTRHVVWDYFPPPVQRSLVGGQQDCLPQNSVSNRQDSLSSLASAPSLV